MRGLDDEVELKEALALIGQPLVGTHHRGDDDAWNIAALLASVFTGHEPRSSHRTPRQVMPEMKHRTVPKLFKKGADGRYEIASWYHEGDFGDDRSSSCPVSFLDDPKPETVVTADGVSRPAMVDQARGYAVIDIPEEVVGG
jgi:hypothetical protein